MKLQRAQNDDGQAPWEPVPEGLHYLHNIAHYILYTVDARLSDDFAASDIEKRVMVLDIKAEPLRLWENITWTWITNFRGRGSILRDLGFTEDAYGCQYDPQALGFRTAASKRVALFRWPAPGYPAPRRIYIHGMESDWQPIGWNHAIGWTTTATRSPHTVTADVIDVDSFLKLVQELQNKRDNWVILPGDDARKLIEEELKLTQQQIVPGLGKLYMISMEPPVEAMPYTVEHLCGPAQTITDPDQGMRFDRSPGRVVNVANVSADYDYAVKKFFLSVKNRAQDSLNTWGEKQPVQIEARGEGRR